MRGSPPLAPSLCVWFTVCGDVYTFRFLSCPLLPTNIEIKSTLARRRAVLGHVNRHRLGTIPGGMYLLGELFFVGVHSSVPEVREIWGVRYSAVKD